VITSSLHSDEAGLFHGVLANPVDDAPRLIYADWLDEREDERGAYLRLDLELARLSRDRADWQMSRAQRLRRRLNRRWVVEVSCGPADHVKCLDLFRRDVENPLIRDFKVLSPCWQDVENAANGLDNDGPYFVRMRFGDDYKECDYMQAVGGPIAIELTGRLDRELRRYRNNAGRPGVWHNVGNSATQETYMCLCMATVIRAMKWAYYYRAFDPDISWTGGPVNN